MSKDHGKGNESTDDDDSFIALFISEPLDPSKVPMYSKNLVYADGQEYSPEEIRARRYYRDEDLKLKEMNGEKQSSMKIIKADNDEISNDVRKKFPALLDAHTDKENYPDHAIKQVNADLKGIAAPLIQNHVKISRSGVPLKENKYCENELIEKSNRQFEGKIDGDTKQHAPIYNALLENERNPSVLVKGITVMENSVSSIPKYSVVPSKDTQRCALVTDGSIDKEKNPKYIKKDSLLHAAPMASRLPRNCSVPPSDEQQLGSISDVLIDKENIPGYVKSSSSLLQNVLPTSGMPKHASGNKTFVKDDTYDEGVSHLDDDVFIKPGLELDVTSYTKAFNNPSAVSTPGFGGGKSRNLKGSGSESKALSKFITEKLDNPGEPVIVSSELSIIEETSRECTSGSSGANSAATLATAASDIRNSNPAISCLSNASVNGSSSRIPTILGGGIAEVSRSQMSRIPYSVNRCKARTSGLGDLSKDSTVGLNTTGLNETMDINSKKVRNSGKNMVCASMDDICKQMKEMIIALDPFEQSQTDNFLSQLPVPVSSRIGYYSVPQRLPQLKTNSDFHLRKDARDGGHLFKALKAIGQGAYAKVYKAYSMKWKKMVALKVQKPACPWEFYISHEIHSRITDHLMKNSFMNVKEACFFNDASILISDYMEHGTLLDVINLYKIRRIRFPEPLAVYFTLEVLKIINNLHSCKIIHGDVKPDNFLLRRLPQTNEEFSSLGQTVLQLIDLGRCIDMTLYPSNTCFNAVFQKSFFQCIEMRSKKQWSYQVDMFHIASLVHVMIFGDFMDVVCKGGVWNVTKKVPRNLNQDLWNWFFNVMLNIESCTKLPNLSEIIQKFEKVFSNSMVQDMATAVSSLRKYFNEEKAKVK